MKKIIKIVLLVILVMGIKPYIDVEAVEEIETINIPVNLSSNKESIANGQKAVEYNISYLNLSHPNGYTIDTNEFDLNDLHNLVRITVNGLEESPVDSKGNLKYDISYNQDENRIEIKIKEGQSDLEHLKPFILRKHKHYNIKVPKGFFINKDKSETSEEINYNFTTRGDGLYKNDIIYNVSPERHSTEIDYKNNKIILSFIDDIDFTGNENFTISSRKMTDPAVGGFDQVNVENLNNYNVTIDGNKLIFQKHKGRLDDFAKYTLVVSSNSLVLKNSMNLANIVPISNKYTQVNFDTDNWVDWTYPVNNQGRIDSERVERNPFIKIKLKYPVELIDKSKISLSSDGHIYSVDVDKDTWISYDGDILKIDINSLYRSGENPLRANAAYKVTIGPGALKLRDHNIAESEEEMKNKEINLYFITGKHFIKADPGLNVRKYTSDKDINHDDISYLDQSKLDKDGNIYIHFNRDIKWNKWTSNPKVESDEDALEYFNLYKKPRAHRRKHNEEGIVYDEEFRYDINKKSLPHGGLDEIPIKSVELIENLQGQKRIIKISPKYDLINLNEYIVRLTKNDIITDNEENFLNQDINHSIYTRAKEEKYGPQWDMDKISPEEIIEVTTGPYKTYTIHGAPNYNEYINGKGKPITLYLDREVVLDPYKRDPLGGISLYEGYREDDLSLSKKRIKWYKLENYYDEGVKKTKISLYPEGELHSGRYYKLNIEEGVFKSRANRATEEIKLNFVIEGDENIGRGIYKFKTSLDYDIYLNTDFDSGKDNIRFDITGYNFKEDIRRIRFVRKSDGSTIIVPKNDLIFHDVTKISGQFRGSSKKSFANPENGGVYNIYIDFDRGSSASIVRSGQNFISRPRPKLTSTKPYNGENYFDPSKLKKSFGDDEGYYIEAIFTGIWGPLELVNDYPEGIKVNVLGDDGNNLVDENKKLQYEINGDEIKVYIPLKDKLGDMQEYEVEIPESILVKYKYGREIEKRNRGYKFTFNTNYRPKADKLYEGSVPEFYDYDYPIVIDGSFFRRDTEVDFRDMNGKFYSSDYVTLRDKNEKLYVYLPKSPRLPVGLYDIIVSNGRNYEVEMVHGVLSVVEEGDYIPNEDYRVKKENDIGMVKEIIGTSKDIIDLNNKSTNQLYLEIDLDELMGSEVWVRSIEYPTNRKDSINNLKLKSDWSNISIKNLKLHRDADENKIKLRAGRVEASFGDILKGRIIDKSIKSNFIEVDGENFDFNEITIEIPYFESEGENLKILRYDENTREFKEITSKIDQLDRKVIGKSKDGGVFVIVE